jgi:hypothetical protein
MNANVFPLAQVQNFPNTTVVRIGNHSASAAAERIGRDASEIERLPFDLSVLQNEVIFINVDATGFGILDRRLN